MCCNDSLADMIIELTSDSLYLIAVHCIIACDDHSSKKVGCMLCIQHGYETHCVPFGIPLLLDRFQ